MTDAAGTPPPRDTLTIRFHADARVTIAGRTMPAKDAAPILAQAAARTPPPLLDFVPDEDAGFEGVGAIIHQAVRSGFPDHCFSFHDPATWPALRPATSDDIPFLLALRHQTMDAAMIAAGKAPSDAAHLQRVLHAFGSAQVVELAGVPVGLVKVIRTAPVWDLVQIQVAPPAQRQGLGTRLVSMVIAQAQAEDAHVKLSVFKVNPARHLYQRLGFRITGETDDAYDMLYTNPRSG